MANTAENTDPCVLRSRHRLMDGLLRLLNHKEFGDSSRSTNCRGAPRPFGWGLHGAPKSLVDHQFYVDAPVTIATLRICIFGGTSRAVARRWKNPLHILVDAILCAQILVPMMIVTFIDVFVPCTIQHLNSCASKTITHPFRLNFPLTWLYDTIGYVAPGSPVLTDAVRSSQPTCQISGRRLFLFRCKNLCLQAFAGICATIRN
jgi:hypothetical protein